MIIKILIGAVALAGTLGLFVAPVVWWKERKLRIAFQDALTKFEIIFCDACGEYKKGKFSLCFDCIKKIASESKGGV